MLNRSEFVPSFLVWILIAFVAAALGVARLIRSRTPKPLTPREFTNQFVDRLRSKMPGCKVEINADKGLRIISAKGKESTAFLDNAYAVYVQNPTALAAIIDQYTDGFAASQRDESPIERSRIVPIVKDRKWLTDIRESLKARGAKEPPENVFDDLNEQLVVVYAEDNPKSIYYLTPKNLTELGLEHGELRKLAVENLKRMLPSIQVIPGPQFSMLKADGNYEASLLLFDEIWSGKQIKVDGDYVVAVPSREALLVTGSHNLEGIAKLRELAAQIARESPYRLSAELLVYRKGSFQRLPPQ